MMEGYVIMKGSVPYVHGQNSAFNVIQTRDLMINSQEP